MVNPVLDNPLFASRLKRRRKNRSTHNWCIGTGDRLPGAVTAPAKSLMNVLAVCDVDKNHLEKATGWPRMISGHPADMYEDYRKLLDRKDIEVVTIVTPDHWHTKIAIEAMKAGKDVYCEKPLTLTIDEGKQIFKVLKETGRVFQVGTQQRSEFEPVPSTDNIAGKASISNSCRPWRWCSRAAGQYQEGHVLNRRMRRAPRCRRPMCRPN